MSIFEQRILLLIKGLIKLEQEKNMTEGNARDIRGVLAVESTPSVSSSISTSFKVAVNRGFMKARSQSKTVVFYSLTLEGRAFFEENASMADTLPFSVFESTTETAKQNDEPSPTRYSSKALEAIEGLTELIDLNDALTQTLRSIHSQTGRLLNEIDEKREAEID